MKHDRFWVLVCDGGRSKVFAGEGHLHALVPVEEGWRVNDAPDPGEHRHGERATGYASTGAGRYSVDEHGDPRRDMERAFLGEQLAWLVQEEAAFDHLLLVAPSRALGELRLMMPPVLAAKLIGEIASDLTKAPIGEVVARVSAAYDEIVRKA